MFVNTYTAMNGQGTIAFASSFRDVSGHLRFSQGQILYVRSQHFSIYFRSRIVRIFQKRVGAGFFGGEGFIMQRLSGQGMAFVEFDGYIKEYMLQPGQSIIVDTGYLAAMDSSCSIDIQTVPGLKNIMFGGEGVFNTVVTGPGRVFLQSMPISQMAGCLRPYLPSGK